MARLKIQFTEDQIKLIKNLRFTQIEPNFSVTPCHEDVSVKDVGNGRYNISNIVRIDGKPVAESIAPIEVLNNSDFGDNL